ncbi:MAG: alpha/beta fold hydrolase [Leptolyngbyaceae cyanobacterium HOT.MB2.61]|nr:alpha/beta fold hydrolase [Leptolyngbyaceae cyanobacterium HOT.MB2.61]
MGLAKITIWLGLATLLGIGAIALLSVADSASANRRVTQELLQKMRTETQRQKAVENLKSAAAKLVNLLAQEKFEEVTKSFDSTMQKALPPEKLKATWAAVLEEAGPFKRQAGSKTLKEDKYDVVVVNCEFEKTRLDIRVVYDSNKKVAGLFIVPPSQAADTYKPPSYVNREAFQEKAVTIGSAPSAVPGMLTVPKGEGPFPAVVLVQGSGPHDRDETIGPNKPFRDLAWGLASQGVAVLRYDKRTRVHPGQFSGKFTVKEEATDDAIAAIALLRQTPSIDPDKIFLLGHSLGGMLAPRIAQQEPSLAGIIILAGNTRPFEDLYVAQSEYLAKLDDRITPREKQAIAAFKQQAERIKDRDLRKEPDTELLLGAPPAYWLDLKDYKQTEVARELKQSILILQGERDYQVTLDDFRGWQKALSDHKNATFKTYSNLNHLFMPGEGKSTPQEYQVANHVDAVVITDIATWVKQSVLQTYGNP